MIYLKGSNFLREEIYENYFSEGIICFGVFFFRGVLKPANYEKDSFTRLGNCISLNKKKHYLAKE